MYINISKTFCLRVNSINSNKITKKLETKHDKKAFIMLSLMDKVTIKRGKPRVVSSKFENQGHIGGFFDKLSILTKKVALANNFYIFKIFQCDFKRILNCKM